MATMFPFVVKRTEHLVRPEANPRLRISRTPTLLSLDGGGMRGVITAQVLGQLEDSIKQVLWKERLISLEAAGALLTVAVKRAVITEQQKQDFYREYTQSPPVAVIVDINDTRSDADYKALWAEYRAEQYRLLSPPDQWQTLKKCFDIDIADFFDQLAGTSTGGLLALYCE
jgi:patatin-like phospholipase/acyl hydrolase